MTDKSLSRRCPNCGAELSTASVTCPKCAEKTEKPSGVVADSSPPSETASPIVENGTTWGDSPPGRAGSTFGLGSLMLVITLLCVWFGLLATARGLGIVFAIFAAPALVRTAMNAERNKQAGFPRSNAEKITLFLASLAIMVLISVATGATFYCVCWSIFGAGMLIESGDYAGIVVGLFLGIPLGGVAGLIVLYKLTRFFWWEKAGGSLGDETSQPHLSRHDTEPLPPVP